MEHVLSVDETKVVALLANVDTGASFCIFQRQFAEQLEIAVESGLHQTVRTPTGSLEVYGHSVKLSCFEWDLDTTVYFAASEQFSRNVLGRVGWLQHFRVGVVDHESTLYLSQHDD